MLITQQDIIQSILLNEQFEHQTKIRDVVLPLLAESNSAIVTKLSVAMLLCHEATVKKIDCLKHIQEKFSTVLNIIEEFGVKLPEEESMLQKCIDSINEEGEAAAPIANVTAGIEPNVPRIPARKRVVDASKGKSTK